MISVCMATYNGGKYLREQIDSILCQLKDEDELIISDDYSKDNTVEIIKSYDDKRIKFFFNEGKKGVTHNFENALKRAKGDIIFLSDQDDIWLPNKIEEQSNYLLNNNYDCVTCNCSLTDSNLNVIRKAYYTTTSPIDVTWLMNWVKNLWLGACMCFTKDTLQHALPFPSKAVTHDFWLALFFQMKFRCGYCPKVLQLYRRHNSTVSFAGGKSNNPLMYRIKYRLYILPFLLKKNLL